MAMHEIDAGVVLSAAEGADTPAARALLAEAGLPESGLSDHVGTLWVLRDRDGAAIGAIAYEDYHPFALVRSLVVAKSHRGRGYGRKLLRFVLAHLAEGGFTTAYALTTTIPGLLLRMGFAEIVRDEVPEPVQASAELRGACPLSAPVFAYPVSD